MDETSKGIEHNFFLVEIKSLIISKLKWIEFGCKSTGIADAIAQKCFPNKLFWKFCEFCNKASAVEYIFNKIAGCMLQAVNMRTTISEIGKHFNFGNSKYHSIFWSSKKHVTSIQG